MPPYQTGGDMIRHVTFEKTEFNVLPYKFEAGTPNIAGVIGFGAAIDYLQSMSFEEIHQHEISLLNYATEKLNALGGIKIFGEAENKSGIISFGMNEAHPHDIATILDQYGVAVRAGHHCAMPLIDRLGVSALTRASFGVYNQLSDIDALIQALVQVKKLFGN